MFADIVLPKDNEEEFIQVAETLGYKKLHFLYDFNGYDEGKIQRKIDLAQNNKNINIQIGLIVNQKNMNKASRKSKLLVAKSSENDRLLIESKKVKIIYGFEESNKKDYLHQRASGLNHIICELANKNNVCIGFSYSRLFNENKMVVSLLIGRMMQNLALCRKYKVKTMIGSFSTSPYELRAPHDISSLFAMLGMDRKNVEDSLTISL